MGQSWEIGFLGVTMGHIMLQGITNGWHDALVGHT